MPEQPWRSANFSFLAVYDAQLVRLGALAERYFKEDPATCLIKLRQYGETLAQLVAAKAGLYRDAQEPQADLLRRLKFDRVITPEVGEKVGALRAGNAGGGLCEARGCKLCLARRPDCS
jgi:type I restriction enzyme, R subunit